MVAFVIMTVLLVAVPFSGLYPFFVMQALCFALFACAFNLLLGYVGLLSFGHAMFMGTAGYVTAHLAKVGTIGFKVPLIGEFMINMGPLSPELSIVFGLVAALVLSVITGLIAIRRQGIYFAMITLALSQLIFFLYLQTPFTHGEDGIQGIPQGMLFGLFNLSKPITLYYVILVGFLIGFLVIFRTINSPFGEVLKAIRENEPRAISLGYEVDRYKLLAFVLSAGLAGLAGGLKTLVMGFATLTDAHWQMSGEVILMSLLGGVGTFFGPVLGAGIVISLQDLLADKVGAWVNVIIGVIFVVCVLAFRKGVVGELQAWFERRRARANAPVAPTAPVAGS
jgi:branched-chain amino acid transport system permease protein